MRLALHFVAPLAFFLTAALARAVALEIAIRPTFDGQPLHLDSLRYSDSAGETLSISRLSYLLSNFALEREDLAPLLREEAK